MEQLLAQGVQHGLGEVGFLLVGAAGHDGDAGVDKTRPLSARPANTRQAMMRLFDVDFLKQAAGVQHLVDVGQGGAGSKPGRLSEYSMVRWGIMWFPGGERRL